MTEKGSSMDSKRLLRQAALRRRAGVTGREARSRTILGRLKALEEYRRARVEAWYVGVGDEVATLPGIEEAIGAGRRVAVPAVENGRIELYLIESPAELEPAPFGLLEPASRLRTEAHRRVPPAQVDFFAVPGLAFDVKGGRLGHGKGYYDRLLCSASGTACLAALAFDSMLVDAVPLEPHDITMHLIITESGVFRV